MIRGQSNAPCRCPDWNPGAAVGLFSRADVSVQQESTGCHDTRCPRMPPVLTGFRSLRDKP